MTQDPAMAQARPGLAGMRAAEMRRDYATTFLTEVLVIASYLVAFRLVAVHFGQSGFGEYALSRRTLSLISPLAVVGVDVAIARYVAYALAQRSGKERGYAGAALLIMAVTVTVVSAALLFFQDFFADLFFGSTSYRDLITPLPVMLIGSGLHVVAYGYLRGRSLIQRANILMALNQAVIPLAAVYLAKDVSEILLMMGAGWMVVSASFLVATRFSTGELRDRSEELLKFGLPRVPGDFLQLALFALPGILVAHLVDIQTAGIVAFGIAALGMVGTALTPISFVLLPAVSGYFARGSVEQVRQQVLAIARVALPLLAAAIIVLEFFARPIVADYLGPEFASGADLLRVIMLGALPWGVYVILKSVIDARYVRPINARNLFVAFVVFVTATFGFRAIGVPPIGTVEGFVVSLYVLGALTVFEVVRIFRKERLTEQSDAVGEPARGEDGRAVSEPDGSAERMGRFLRDLEMYLQDTGLLLVPLLTLSVILLLLGAWATFGQSVLLIALTVMLSIVGVTVIIQLDLNRRTQVWNYRQTEALFSIYAALDIVHPMPPMRGWAVSPDFANVVVSLIRDSKPRTIVEAGSGISTLVVGYSLKRQGGGMLYSLDQDERYAKVTQANVSRHGLEEFVSVRHAPLRKVRIHDKDWLWYDLEKLTDVESIDMVIVDGPPGNIQRLARYPALPLLADRLSERAVMVLDDCFRHAEKEILMKWLGDFPAFTSETVGTEKGTVILRKSEGVPLLNPPIQIPFLDFAVTRIQD